MMMTVRDIVSEKVDMYEAVVDLCTRAATRIYKEKLKSIAEKKKVFFEISKECFLHSPLNGDEYRVRIVVPSDAEEVFEAGFILESKKMENIYVCMHLRFDLDENNDETYWKASCFHCETTDSDVEITYEGGSCACYGYVEQPQETRETYKAGYAIWDVNRVDPWQEHWILDHAVAGESFESFYCDYVDEFGAEIGQYRDPPEECSSSTSDYNATV